MKPITAEHIALRFEECVSTLHKLPGEKSLGYKNYWPEIHYDQRELARQEVQPIRLRPTPDQITRMEETLTWITWIDECERKLIWLRAYHTPWRVISRETGLARTSAQRYWQRALMKVEERLAKSS